MKEKHGSIPEEEVHVPILGRDLAGNLVGAHGMLVWLLTEAEVVTDKDERHRDAEPHGHQRDRRRERNLRTHIPTQIPTPMQIDPTSCFLAHALGISWSRVSEKKRE